MARFDGAEWRPVGVNFTRGGQESVQGVVIHIMDGTLEGTDSWFRNPAASASSHFGTGKSGVLRQWVDTTDRAWAQGNGNRNWLSIENEGRGGDTLTEAQLDRCADVLRWANRVHGVPIQLATGTGGRGLGYHGMGGAAWGGHTSCPGSRVVAQLGEIVRRAGGGGGAAAPATEPFPGDAFFKRAPNSPVVTAMGRRLTAVGCSAYKSGPGPQWTEADRQSVKKWQVRLGDAPAYCDGYPGKRQWDALKVPKV